MGQLWSLQYLRAVAAIGVVVFHVLEATSHRWPAGAAGVDVFFVLSGFLMFALTARRPVSAGQFLLDRVVRIVPFYWVATVVVFAAALASAHGIHLVSRDPVQLVRSLVFLPGMGGAAVGGRVYPTLFVGWTLDYEMFFYVAFALTLPLPRARRLPVLTGGFAVLLVAGALGIGRGTMLAVYEQPIILEFLAGAWIALVFGEAAEGRLTRPGLAAGLGAIFAVLLAAGSIGASAAAVPAAGLLAGAVALERFGRVPRWTALRFVGDASYSIYLFQVVAFAATDTVLFHAGRTLHLPLDRAAIAVPARLAAGIGLGLAVHVAVEKPLLRASRRLATRAAGLPARIAATA